jgi:hypothetical protein
LELETIEQLPSNRLQYDTLHSNVIKTGDWWGVGTPIPSAGVPGRFIRFRPGNHERLQFSFIQTRNMANNSITDYKPVRNVSNYPNGQWGYGQNPSGPVWVKWGIYQQGWPWIFTSNNGGYNDWWEVDVESTQQMKDVNMIGRSDSQSSINWGFYTEIIDYSNFENYGALLSFNFTRVDPTFAVTNLTKGTVTNNSISVSWQCTGQMYYRFTLANGSIVTNPVPSVTSYASLKNCNSSIIITSESLNI